MAFAHLAILLITGLAVAIAIAVARTAWVLCNPPRRGYAFAVSRSLPGTPAEVPPSMGGPFEFREWVHRDSSLNIECPVWEIPGANRAGAVVVMTHGWGESRIHALPRVEPFRLHAAAIILWDLPGHGDARGRCSLGTREIDALTSLVRALSPPSASDTPRSVPVCSGGIVLYGFSLGAGVSIAAAAEAPSGLSLATRGIIAEAPYRIPITPAAAVLAKTGMPAGWVLRLALSALRMLLGPRLDPHTFDRARHAETLRSPLLILRGTADDICPLSDAQAIAAATRSPCEVAHIEGAGHGDVWTTDAARKAAANAVTSALTTWSGESAGK